MDGSDTLLPVTRSAFTNLELQTFHCSPPNFQASTAGPDNTSATPSQSPMWLISIRSWPASCQNNAFVYPVSCTPKTPYLLQSCNINILCLSNSLTTRSIFLSSTIAVLALTHAVSGGPSPSMSDLTFHEAKYQREFSSETLSMFFVQEIDPERLASSPRVNKRETAQVTLFYDVPVLQPCFSHLLV